MLAKRVMLICMEAVVVVGVIGCGAPKIFSTDAGVYQNGKLYGVSSKDMDSVYSATLYAMDKLQLQITDKAKDVFAAKVIAKSADGKIVVVKMKPTTDKKTEFEIGVGALGDEERSRRVFDEIG
ncbi:MAG: DUF3568 domain-containing protein, partial [Sedimentisphaerales bacterium]|nr:DUF3568 domain-containing protein [Sedimentisphaerales bacterium]